MLRNVGRHVEQACVDEDCEQSNGGKTGEEIATYRFHSLYLGELLSDDSASGIPDISASSWSIVP